LATTGAECQHHAPRRVRQPGSPPHARGHAARRSRRPSASFVSSAQFFFCRPEADLADGPRRSNRFGLHVRRFPYREIPSCSTACAHSSPARSRDERRTPPDFLPPCLVDDPRIASAGCFTAGRSIRSTLFPTVRMAFGPPPRCFAMLGADVGVDSFCHLGQRLQDLLLSKVILSASRANRSSSVFLGRHCFCPACLAVDVEVAPRRLVQSSDSVIDRIRAGSLEKAPRASAPLRCGVARSRSCQTANSQGRQSRKGTYTWPFAFIWVRSSLTDFSGPTGFWCCRICIRGVFEQHPWWWFTKASHSCWGSFFCLRTAIEGTATSFSPAPRKPPTADTEAFTRDRPGLTSTYDELADLLSDDVIRALVNSWSRSRKSSGATHQPGPDPGAVL